ncbi:MAG TPA: F0F1 ATP synthase subunit delta [Candidatus Saccharimonadales bacterium]|nr:F0F1 ATP synthase subunit delta [Candidatus Saccharimonadales bacterium]
MHKVSRRRLASTVAQLLRERPQDRSHTLQMLAAYLVEHNQQKRVDLLLLDIAHELAVTEGHLYAEVSSAHPLDDAARAELKKYLVSATGAKAIELNEQVDADLLAGLVVRTADQELDTSARTKLDKLKSLNVNTTPRA